MNNFHPSPKNRLSLSFARLRREAIVLNRKPAAQRRSLAPRRVALDVLKSRLEKEIKQPALMYSQSLRFELFRIIPL
jgi:hypothetical protein